MKARAEAAATGGSLCIVLAKYQIHMHTHKHMRAWICDEICSRIIDTHTQTHCGTHMHTNTIGVSFAFAVNLQLQWPSFGRGPPFFYLATFFLTFKTFF